MTVKQLTFSDLSKAVIQHVVPSFDGETYAPDQDQARLTRQLDRVRQVMQDGHFHTLRELADTVGGSEAGVSARLRDLRRKELLTIDKERVPGVSGLWRYRLVAAKEQAA